MLAAVLSSVTEGLLAEVLSSVTEGSLLLIPASVSVSVSNGNKILGLCKHITFLLFEVCFDKHSISCSACGFWLCSTK